MSEKRFFMLRYECSAEQPNLFSVFHSSLWTCSWPNRYANWRKMNFIICVSDFRKFAQIRRCLGWPFADLTTIFPLKAEFCVLIFQCFLYKNPHNMMRRNGTQTRTKMNQHTPLFFIVIANVNIWTTSIINPNVWTLMGPEMNFAIRNLK